MPDRLRRKGVDFVKGGFKGWGFQNSHGLLPAVLSIGMVMSEAEGCHWEVRQMRNQIIKCKCIREQSQGSEPEV